MYELPKEPRKIRERIRRYERKIQREKDVLGRVRDGAGKRLLLGPLYMLMGDLDGALRSFKWFEEEFPDDCGDPGQGLCWALALYHSGQKEAAARKLRQADDEHRRELRQRLEAHVVLRARGLQRIPVAERIGRAQAFAEHYFAQRARAISAKPVPYGLW